MDAIRSAYSCQARFFKDDPTKLTTIRWFFVKDNTPQVPYAHPFGQRIWDERENLPQATLGEVYGTRTYYNGKPPYWFFDYGLCGSQSQWEQGASTDDPLPPFYQGTKVPRCCGAPQPNDPFAPDDVLFPCCCDPCCGDCCGNRPGPFGDYL